FGCAALVKGGHLPRTAQAVDAFFDGENEFVLSSPRIRRVSTHGTGCTYSAAIVAHLARGEQLSRAVELAKMFVTGAIASSRRVAGHRVLHFEVLSRHQTPATRKAKFSAAPFERLTKERSNPDCDA